MSQPPSSGFALWFTGLPGAGKTTLARALQASLAARGTHAELLDSDELRIRLIPQSRYTPDERDWFYHLLVVIAELLTRNGVNVIIAATAHLRRYRDEARAALPRFAEVYVACDVETCRARDPKGLWARAGAGEIHALPGFDEPYDAPLHPDAVIPTATISIAEAVDHLEALIKEKGWNAD